MLHEGWAACAQAGTITPGGRRAAGARLAKPSRYN